MIKSIRMIGMSALVAGLGLLAAPVVAQAQDSVFVTATGNVGIGTANPGARLEVSGGEVRLPAGQGGTGFTHFNFSSNGQNYIRGTTVLADNGGNVGIGTANPGARLEVSGGEVRLPPGQNGIGFTHFNFTGNGQNYIRGTTVLADNGGNVGIGTAAPAQKLTVKSNIANGDVFTVQRSQADSQTIMRLFETTSGAGLISLFDDAGNEDFRITGSGGMSWYSGTVGINCNNPAGFDFSIKSGFGASTACNTGTCSQINAGSTTFTACSSRAIKENLQPVRVPDILEKIAAIDVYKYDFIEGPKDRLGLMAEDFHQVFTHGSDKMLNGQDVEMALWLAVKELTAQNKELIAQNKEISERLAQLEARFVAEPAASPGEGRQAVTRY